MLGVDCLVGVRDASSRVRFFSCPPSHQKSSDELQALYEEEGDSKSAELSRIMSLRRLFSSESVKYKHTCHTN